MLALTRHRPRREQHYLQILAEEVARDFTGRVIVGEDLTEIEV
jgi:ribonuclease Z